VSRPSVDLVTRRPWDLDLHTVCRSGAPLTGGVKPPRGDIGIPCQAGNPYAQSVLIVRGAERGGRSGGRGRRVLVFNSTMSGALIKKNPTDPA